MHAARWAQSLLRPRIETKSQMARRRNKRIAPYCWRSVRAGAATQVSLDQDVGAAAEAVAVDLHVLHHALDVVARLRERDALDPVDRIDLGIARVAEPSDPFPNAAAAGIVA